MTDVVPAAPLLRRRHRDEPIRSSTVSSMQNPPMGATRPADGPSGTPAQGSVEAVLAGGHRWLRFPKALERDYLRDTHPGHMRRLYICGLIGLAVFWFASANNLKLVPDVDAALIVFARYFVTAMIAATYALLAVPSLRRATWFIDSANAVNGLIIAAIVIGLGRESQANTAYVHGASVISVIMYAGIAARQRFWFTFTLALLVGGGYALLVHAQTPIGQLIVSANLRLLLSAIVFTLIANYAFEHGQRRAWLLRRLTERRTAALALANERLRQLARIDTLTGLYNRRQFDTDMARAWAQAIEQQRPVALLLVDVDHFKAFNDSYGHPAGDTALQQVAHTLATCAQTRDGSAARLGGEEFALLLPGRDEAGARAVAESLRASVAALALPHRASSTAPHVTASIGIASVQPQAGDGSEGLFDAADEALYEAKHGGRNRVASAEVITAPRLDTEEADSLPTAAVATTSEQLHALLRRGHRRLRFPAGLETAYRQAHAGERKRALFIAGAIGIAFFNGYTWLSRAMFPDALQAMWHAQVTLTCLHLALLALLFLPLGWRTREALFTLGASATALASFAALGQSEAVTVYGYSMVLCLVPLFAGVAARQPFWFTCIPSLATLAGSMIWLRGTTPETELMALDSRVLLTTAVLFTLIASYTLEHGHRLTWALQCITREQLAELARTTQRLRSLSILDPLTGIPNRRQFELDLKRFWSEASRAGRPMSLLILDVDHFKLFNDSLGHPAGDKCLKQVATLLAETAAAEEASAFRIGGEEFAVLLPGRTLHDAHRLGEALRLAVRDAAMPHPQSTLGARVTISVGIATIMPKPGEDRRRLLIEADAALYAAKTAGRDRVGVA